MNKGIPAAIAVVFIVVLTVLVIGAVLLPVWTYEDARSDTVGNRSRSDQTPFVEATDISDEELKPYNLAHSEKGTEEEYRQAAEALSQYMTMRGFPITSDYAYDYLKRENRMDVAGLYLAASRQINADGSVIMCLKNNFRMLPCPVLIRCGREWRIMAYTSELEVRCYDPSDYSSGGTMSYPPVKFEISYFDGGWQALYITDRGHSPET